jgi:hypothetical protein
LQRGRTFLEAVLEVLGLAGYGDFEEYAGHLGLGTTVPGALDEGLRSFAATSEADLPDDDDPFGLESDIPASADGDFPPDHHLPMHELLPPQTVELGEEYETNFNGTFVSFDASQVGQIVQLLTNLGCLCTQDQELIEAAVALRS